MRRRKRPTRRQVMLRLIAEVSDAMARAHRHPFVNNGDLKQCLAVALSIQTGEGPRIVVEVRQ